MASRSWALDCAQAVLTLSCGVWDQKRVRDEGQGQGQVGRQTAARIYNSGLRRRPRWHHPRPHRCHPQRPPVCLTLRDSRHAYWSRSDKRDRYWVCVWVGWGNGKGNADAAPLAAPRARELPCLVLQIALVQELLDPGNGVDLAGRGI